MLMKARRHSQGNHLQSIALLSRLATPAIPGPATPCQDPATSHSICLVQVLDDFAALKHRSAGVGILYVGNLHRSKVPVQVAAGQGTAALLISSMAARPSLVRPVTLWAPLLSAPHVHTGRHCACSRQACGWGRPHSAASWTQC